MQDPIFTPDLTPKAKVLAVIDELVAYEEGWGTKERINELLVFEDLIKRNVVIVA